MAEIIDLNKIDLPDCKACTDHTKRISAHTMDVEGPGMPGVLYSCENRRCRAKRNEIAIARSAKAEQLFQEQLRRLGIEEEP